jgi:hypothetical protein
MFWSARPDTSADVWPATEMAPSANAAKCSLLLVRLVADELAQIPDAIQANVSPTNHGQYGQLVVGWLNPQPTVRRLDDANVSPLDQDQGKRSWMRLIQRVEVVHSTIFLYSLRVHSSEFRDG